MSCLVIKNDGIGDLIITSGLISSLAEHFGGELDLLTHSSNLEIAEGIEGVRHIYTTKREAWGFAPGLQRLGIHLPKAPRSELSLWRTLRSQTYDVAIVLRRFIRKNTLSLMTQVRARQRFCAWQMPTNIDYHSAQKLTRGWDHYQGPIQTLHEIDYYDSFIKNFTGKQFCTHPRLSFCRREGEGITGKIALSISGSSTNWQESNWVALAMILRRRGYRLILVGGEDAKDLADAISIRVPDATNYCGKLCFRETAPILESCQMVVSNDTGMAHFASLICDHVLVVLGGGTFRRFFPWPNNDNQYIVYHGLECFDCDWHCKFQDRRCLSLITPSDVADNVERILSGKEAIRETDLNCRNELYQLGWRRLPAETQLQKSIRL